MATTTNPYRITEARDLTGVLLLGRDRWLDTGEETLRVEIFWDAGDEEEGDEAAAEFVLSMDGARELAAALLDESDRKAGA